jgi:hypothetical protein
MAAEFSPGTRPADLIAAFQETGVVVVRGLAPPELLGQIRHSLAAAMRRALERQRAPAAGDDLDALFRTLLSVSPEHASTILTLGRDLPGFFGLAGWFAGTSEVQSLAGSTVLQVVGDLCLLRVDAPHADETGFDWHQDYPYNMMARGAVTVWAPLAPVTPEMGLLRYVPGSHAELLPIDIRRGPARRHTGQRQVAISDLAARAPGFEARALSLPPLNAGDVVIFASQLVHRSGANRSDACRWVFNARYGDLLDPELVDRRWYTTRVKYPHLVAQVHPELVHWVDDPAAPDGGG